MTRWFRLFLVLMAATIAGPSLAVQPDEIMSDPALETRARNLSRELRCMVCQNQSIDDSDAPLARDLRLLVRERISAGDNDNQVINFLVSRYGEFVLLKPRLEWHTLILWGTMPVVLVIGAIALFVNARRRNAIAAAAVPSNLDAAEQEALKRLMTEGPGGSGGDNARG